MKKLLYFSAEWCHPCKIFGPQLLTRCAVENIPLTLINIDQQKELVLQYHIKSIPTVLIIKDNVVLNKIIGPKLEEIINSFKND